MNLPAALPGGRLCIASVSNIPRNATLHGNGPRMARLPCLRYKITESNLYRIAFQYFDFDRTHLIVGLTYGDFHIKRQWTQSKTKVLEFAQDSNVIFKLRVWVFIFTAEELLSDDARGNKMYSIPWAIADPDEATKFVNLFNDHCNKSYLHTILDDSNHLVKVFKWAKRLLVFSEQPVSVPFPRSVTEKVIPSNP